MPAEFLEGNRKPGGVRLSHCHDPDMGHSCIGAGMPDPEAKTDYANLERAGPRHRILQVSPLQQTLLAVL